MKQRNKKRFDPEFKARVALEALQEKESLAQLGRRHGVHPVLVGQWKKQLLEKAATAFTTEAAGRDAEKVQDELLRKIGELTVERDFLARGLQRSPLSERRAMVQPGLDTLSVRKQCDLLQVSRSGLYYQPIEVNAEELQLMRRIDELYLARPFYGSRRMTVVLQHEGHEVNRKRVQRLMRLMGLEGMAPGPHTSRPHPEHPVYPYLLRGLAIVKPNQAWAADITYVPLAYGWAYLVAIMDWFSRAVLAWRVSNTLSTDFCIEALEEALRHHGPPSIFNTDQGAQFTDKDWLAVLKGQQVRISMDGKGRCVDNIFVERLWRSLKYEEVYLNAYADVRQAWAGVGRWLRFYNLERPHQALGYRTPMHVYRTGLIEHAA
ncbi:IS3 family transposase [Myxococcus sp. Y35]|uniref:IS3 family transposase n=1 Tax=Pseudomyxococcus flavus TaxID=3115648 RepID=UPI003CF1D860